MAVDTQTDETLFCNLVSRETLNSPMLQNIYIEIHFINKQLEGT